MQITPTNKTLKQWVINTLIIASTASLLSQGFLMSAYAEDEFPNNKQKTTARQVALLLDKAHYLEQPLDQAMGQKILQTYFDALDPNHMLFLQSDIDEFVQKYGRSYASQIKTGDLSAGIEIFERYRQRSAEYNDFAKNLLSNDNLSLETDQEIITDREDLPRFADSNAQKAYWQKQIIYSLINLTLGQQNEKTKDQAFIDNPELSRGQDLVKAETRTPKQILLRRLERQKEQLTRLKNDEIMERILDSAMLAYDPHSNYFAPIAATEMQVQSNLQLEGIGVSIRPDRKNTDYTRIISLVDGGPAAKSGQIRANDLILGVAQDGEPMIDVIGFSTREIVSLIRGKRGTVLTIKVKQADAPDTAARNVTLVRDVIEQDESGVQHRVLTMDYQGSKKRIGVIGIPSFYLNFQARKSGQSNYRSVSKDTENAIKALNQEGIDGLVVDLRGNPGGSLDEVAKMLGFFIKSGPVVQIRDNQGNVLVYEDKDGGKELYKGEMVVLVNLGSASASEIFAAAIQDYGRGLVVGSTTTGKGSAQVQRDDLALGSANLTQRKFYRITGGSTQNKGVVPDVALINIHEGMKFGERDYKNPLPWDTIKTTPYTPYGKYSKALITKLNQQSQARQNTNVQFNYLKTLNEIRDLEDNKKPTKVSISVRQQKNKLIEDRTLAAENARRQALGDTPYANWAVYQANLDAEFEERGAMKENERPKLPESEVYILEAANIMFDATNR